MGYDIVTLYADNVPQTVAFDVSLPYPDWCELEKQPFFRELTAYLDRLETPDKQP